MEDEERKVGAQPRLHGERGQQVHRAEREDGGEEPGDAALDLRVRHHARRDRGQGDEGHARRGERAQEGMGAARGGRKDGGVHGALAQFSLESRIQERPESPLPGAPREPQSASRHRPLWANRRTLRTAFM